MVALVKALAKADADYRANAAKWTADSAQVKAVAKWTKADAAGVPAAMALYRFPTAQEQLSATWLGGRRGQGDDQYRGVPQGTGQGAGREADYGAFVTTTYVQKALGK